MFCIGWGLCISDAYVYSIVNSLAIVIKPAFCVFQSRHNTEEFDIFTLDDVDAAFDKIQQLKYSQTVSLKGATKLISCLFYVKTILNIHT